jgi:hypothetical protein
MGVGGGAAAAGGGSAGAPVWASAAVPERPLQTIHRKSPREPREIFMDIYLQMTKQILCNDALRQTICLTVGALQRK